MIIRNPPENVELHVGNVFNISCQMVGIPSPEIIWRLNWGHIPAKCSTISINGIGVLTCPNIDVSIYLRKKKEDTICNAVIKINYLRWKIPERILAKV